MPSTQDTSVDHQPNSQSSGIRTPLFVASGFRTPRRIQWLDEHRRASDRATRMLDSSGVDAESFGNLVDSLEKHRKRLPSTSETPARDLTSKVHYYSHRPDRARDAPDTSKSPSMKRDDYSDSTPEGSRSLPGHSSATHLHFPHPLSPELGTNKEDDLAETSAYSKKAKWSAKFKAKQIVRHHSVKRPRVHHKDDPGIQLDDGHLSKVDPEDRRRDDEGHGHPEGTGSGGILSSLLELYRNQNASFSERNLSSALSSGCSSAITSGTSTPGWETPASDGSPPETPSGLSGNRKRRPRLPRPRFNVPSLGLVPRHKRARSGGGVIGALIATTGNLGGVAAPINSQLQPDLTRPGFSLSRYAQAEGLPSRQPTPPPVRPPHLRSLSESNIEPRRLRSEAQEPRQRHSLISAPNSPLAQEVSFDRDFDRLPETVHKRPPVLRRMSSFTKTFRSGVSSGRSTPSSFMSSTASLPSQDPHSKPEKKEKEKRKKRKKAEVYITRHIAQIIRREEFLLKLTRAMMMFGAPTHRLQSQIQSAARVLDVQLSILYLPDTTLISFDDGTTGTSHVKLIRQASGLDIGKLTDAFFLYWRVIHDKISVTDASGKLDELMRSPPLYNWWQNILIGGICSSSICTVSFAGSFIDAAICFPLGALLVAIQLLSMRNQLYLHVFEITVSMLFSFLSAGFAATHKFCYSAVLSSSVVLILPGFLVLTAALELMSRNIVSGSVRLCYAIVYALFLGFGFAYGADIYQRVSSTQIYGTEDYTCTASHDPNGPWWQRTPGPYWAFLTVPMFSLFLSLKNGAPWNRMETLVLILIACMGWTTNYFTGKQFIGQSDITAAVGAFTVGIVANVYARLFSGNAFVVMVTGILFQLPNGLGSGGLLSYASKQSSGSPESYVTIFMPTLKLVAVAMGLAIGLGFSVVVTYPIQSRRREAGIFSL